MAKKKLSVSSSLNVILALFIIFLFMYLITTNKSVAIVNKTTTLTPEINRNIKQINPVFVDPIGTPSSRRTYVDLHTYTPNIDITPLKPNV